MAFAVSDTPGPDVREQRAKTGSRPKPRRARPALAIHWPRVIALGVNILAWAGIVAAIRLVWPR